MKYVIKSYERPGFMIAGIGVGECSTPAQIVKQLQTAAPAADPAPLPVAGCNPKRTIGGELEKTKALLDQALADLKEADVNCAYCSHKSPPAPCAEDDEHYTCEDCTHDCYCKDCYNNSKWEYQKTKEANQ